MPVPSILSANIFLVEESPKSILEFAFPTWKALFPFPITISVLMLFIENGASFKLQIILSSLTWFMWSILQLGIYP